MASACCVYAIVGRDTPLPALAAGRTADELSLVSWRELAAVTGRVTDDGAPLGMQAVLHHEAIVEAVRRQGPALPVRLGTLFRDATSVASALAERYEPLAADLDRVGDKVELSLTALWTAGSLGNAPAAASPMEEAPAGQGRGARYMLARAAELRRDDTLKEAARTVARELDAALDGLALERRVALLPRPRVAVRTAYLLDPARASAFRSAVEDVRGSRGDLRILLTGPWPPYSFVRRTDGESAATQDGRLAPLVQLLTDAIQGRPG